MCEFSGICDRCLYFDFIFNKINKLLRINYIFVVSMIKSDTYEHRNR